jgi:ribosome biogenesis GTPase
MNKTTKMSLTDLGYDNYFESEQKRLGFSEYPVARVIAEYREAYRVITPEGEFFAKVTGKQMFSALSRENYPAVGDFVILDKLFGERAVIHKILSRKTVLTKKYSNKQDSQIIATNIDVSFIVESVDRDYNLNRFERYLVLTNEAKIKPIIILNKIDLISETELNTKISQINQRFKGVDIILTSVVTEQGLNILEKSIIRGKTYCFLGSSGVGKSSLINKLLGKNEIKTKEISESTGRGKHTTSTRVMHFLNGGGIVIDNPGTREVGLTDIDVGINEVFDEIILLSRTCKFSDCTHKNEPGCVVLESVEKGMLDKNKYNNYLKLKKEAEFYEMTDLEKRTKDRKFGKFIKKAQDMLKNKEL